MTNPIFCEIPMVKTPTVKNHTVTPATPLPPRPAALVLLSLLLGGCAVGPNYEGAPKFDLGLGWIFQSQEAKANAEAEATEAVAPIALDRWWEALGDETLTRLIEEALERNLDVRQALVRVMEARAALDMAKGQNFPAVDANGNVTRQQQSLNGPLPVGQIPALERNQTIYNLTLDMAWEIDVFGRISRMTESATAQTEATQEDVHGVRISVAAEVGRAYFSLRGAQREREACLASILSLEKTLELTRQRVKAGDLAPAELDRVQAQLDGLRATLPEIEGRIRASALGLGTLTGGLPEQELPLQESQAATFNLPQVPVGERADLLRRRPDIRAAERRLAASTAEIGVAVAEQFPKLKIGASGGFQALESGDLFSGDSRLFSIAPLISWRIFDGGRVKAQIRSAEAKQQMAALAYEKAVLAGLGDGERTLSDYHFALESLNRQKTAVATALRVHASMQERFRAGDVTLLDVLAAEQQLDAVRITEARLATYAATNLIALFRALGGGWESEQRAEPNTGALSEKTTLM